MSKLKTIAARLLQPFKFATGASASSSKAKRAQYETRVYISSQCLIRQEPQPEIISALAAIFVPLLIQKALGGIGGALKKAGAEETLRDSGRLPTYLYQLVKEKEKNTLQLNPELVGGGVIVVRGVFDKPDQPAPAGNEMSETVKLLRGSGDKPIVPVRDVAAVYEAAIKLADDKTALRYESRYFEVNKFQGSRFSKKRAMVISIAIMGAGSKEGEPILFLALMNLGEVSAGTVMEPGEFRSKQSSWLGGLGMSAESVQALKEVTFPAPDNTSDPPNVYGIMPVTVEGTFAETDDGNKALRFIGDVLDSTKEDVAKAVSGEIFKDRGKEAAEAATATEKLQQEEETAYASYLKVKGEFCALGITSPPQDINTLDTSALPIAQRGKVFEFQIAKRAWRLKLTAMQNIGLTPVGKRDNTDACQ